MVFQLLLGVTKEYLGLQEKSLAAFLNDDDLTRKLKSEGINFVTDLIQAFDMGRQIEGLNAEQVQKFKRRLAYDTQWSRIIEAMPQFYFMVPDSRIYKT